MEPERTIRIGSGPNTIEELVAVARGLAAVELSPDEDWQTRIRKGARCLDRLWRGEHVIYGVNTGYGKSYERPVPAELVDALPRQLVRFHGCGLGRALNEQETLAVLFVRLAALSSGASGVRLELLERLRDLVNLKALPRIPEEGSVGASGDLTPLSYIAAVIAGEREVTFGGRVRPTAEVLAELGLEPLDLLPKEALAVMNGTSVMTALACLAHRRAEYLLELCSRITSLAVIGLNGNRGHFDRRIFELKPHPGQARVAEWIRSDLDAEGDGAAAAGSNLQESYSLRCAPHVLGVLADALPWIAASLEIELNSANDNPLLDVDDEAVLHGGNFYGGHVAFAMDALKTAVANVADLLDRQVLLLLTEETSGGLPANLSGAPPERLPINHGFKAVGIGCSAWAAEALKLTLPASVFSRSTESHNQDKVSMGTIAARDCLRVLELTEQVAASALLVALQGIDIRLRSGELDESTLAPSIRRMRAEVRRRSRFVEEDRRLDGDLGLILDDARAERWELFSAERS